MRRRMRRRWRVGVALEGTERCRAAAHGVFLRMRMMAVVAIDTLRTTALIARVTVMVALRLVTARATNLLTRTKLIALLLLLLLLQQVALLLTARVVTRVARRTERLKV